MLISVADDRCELFYVAASGDTFVWRFRTAQTGDVRRQVLRFWRRGMLTSDDVARLNCLLNDLASYGPQPQPKRDWFTKILDALGCLGK